MPPARTSTRRATPRCTPARVNEPDAFWAEQAHAFIDWFPALGRSASLGLPRGRDRLVHRRQAQRRLELPRPSPRGARQPPGDHLGGATTRPESRTLTYRELHAEVCRFANALRGLGVKKGDRVCLYMPMIPEAAVAMLACARIGAIHSVVFGGFSPDALEKPHRRLRLLGRRHRRSGPARRGAKVPLKDNADRACEGAASVKRMVVVRRGRRTGAVARRARPLVSRARAVGARGVSGVRDGRRGSAVRPLHLGLHGPAQVACCTPAAATSCTRR